MGSIRRAGALVAPLFVLAVGAAAADPLEKEPPNVSVEAKSAGNEPGTSAVFTVKLSAPAKPSTTVRFSTAPAEGVAAATAEADYEPKEAVLVTIPKGETTAEVEVEVKDDALDEVRENFIVTLSDASAPAGIAIDPHNKSATGWIADNDDAPAAKLANAPDVTEGNSGIAKAVFTVTLSKKSGRDVRVAYKTQDGTAKAGEDYTGKSGVLEIEAGHTTGTVSVDVMGDTKVESNETFSLAISPGGETATIGQPDQATAKIIDDDAKPEEPAPPPPPPGPGPPAEKPALLSIADVSADEPTGGAAASVTFTVTVSPGVVRAVTVKWATADGTATAGSDYTAASGSLSFAPSETTKTLTVALLADDQSESNETFFVNLTGAAGATVGDAQGMATIVEKGALPSLAIGDVVAREGVGATLTVALTGSATTRVTVAFRTADGTAREGTDYLPRSSTLVFEPGEKTKAIEITVIDDDRAESVETFSVTLSDPVNAVITKNRGLATIESSDLAVSGVGSVGAAGSLPVPIAIPVNAAGPKTPKKTKVLLPRMTLGPIFVSVTQRGIARMTIACKRISPVTCSGRVSLVTAAKPEVALALKSFVVKKGKHAALPLKLTRPALRLLARQGSLRARVIVFVKVGNGMLKVLPGIITLQSQGASTAGSSTSP